MYALHVCSRLVTIQSALIAGIESQLLSTVTATIQGDDSVGAQALLAFTYLALFLTIGATIDRKSVV